MSEKHKETNDPFDFEGPWQPRPEFKDDVRRYHPDDAPYFRDIIMEKISTVKQELGYLEETSLKTLEEYSGDESTYSLHMADQGTDAQEREKAIMFAQRQHKFLRDLIRALRRMDGGTYGYCQDTGIPIEYARLEAVPHATLSIVAKRRREEEKR